MLVKKTSLSIRYKCQLSSPLLELASFLFSSSGIFFGGLFITAPLCLPCCPFLCAAAAAKPLPRFDSRLDSSQPSCNILGSNLCVWSSKFHFSWQHSLPLLSWARLTNQLEQKANMSPVIPAGQVDAKQYCYLLSPAFSYRKVGNR